MTEQFRSLSIYERCERVANVARGKSMRQAAEYLSYQEARIKFPDEEDEAVLERMARTAPTKGGTRIIFQTLHAYKRAWELPKKAGVDQDKDTVHLAYTATSQPGRTADRIESLRLRCLSTPADQRRDVFLRGLHAIIENHE